MTDNLQQMFMYKIQICDNSVCARARARENRFNPELNLIKAQIHDPGNIITTN